MKKFNKIFAIAFAVLFIGIGMAMACDGPGCYDYNNNAGYAYSGTEAAFNTGNLWGGTSNRIDALSAGPGIRSAETEADSLSLGFSTGHVTNFGVAGSFGGGFTTSNVNGWAADGKGLENPGPKQLTDTTTLFKYYDVKDTDTETVYGTIGGGFGQYNGSTAFMGNSVATAFNITGGTYQGFASDTAQDKETQKVGRYTGIVWDRNVAEDTAAIDMTGKTIGGGFTTTYAIDLGPVAFAGGKTAGGSLSYVNGADESCVNVGGSGGIGAVAIANSPGGYAVGFGGGSFGYEAQADHLAAGAGFAKTHNSGVSITTPNFVMQKAHSGSSAGAVSGGF